LNRQRRIIQGDIRSKLNDFPPGKKCTISLIIEGIKLKEMVEHKNENKLVEVFTGELWLATMIKNLLEDNEIKVFAEDEYLGTVESTRNVQRRSNPVHLMVSGEDYDLSMELIEEFNSDEPLKETGE
jgi:hypothetical protein